MSHHPLLPRLLTAAVIGALVLAPSLPVHGQEVPVRMQRDAELDAVLTTEAQFQLDSLELMEGQVPGGRVDASMDLESGVITVMFETSFLPEHYGAAFEDQHDGFRTGLGYLASKVAAVSEIIFLYGGKSIETYFPEAGADRAQEALSLPGGVRAGAAFVSAAHGYYYHHTQRKWVLQRPEGDWVKEDLITPAFASELQLHLQQRSNLPSIRARSQLQEVAHPGSDQAWWKMAARYFIEEAYPDQRSIWHSHEGRVYGLRDYNEDMNSRPLLANFLGAGVAFHLHTNGNVRPSVRGVEVVVQPGDTQSLLLARNALCYMKELINSSEGYEEFPVATAPVQVNKAENRLASMPSIIVEVAYHSNQEDAVALQDPEFRTAAMKGVEKGYRLFREGKECAPLKGDPIESISMYQGTTREVEVPFEGYPRYPMTIITRNVGCPPGWICTGTEVTVERPQEAPLKIALTCRNNGSAPLFWETSLVDDDGVRSEPVRHRQQCIRSS